MSEEELEKENANLKVLRKYELNVAKVEIEKLEKENAELKKRNGELAGQKASLERWFGEAKAIIKDYMIIATADHCEVCSVPEENRCINVLKLNEQAEQFLKEVAE